jgi:hypothetical protein
VGVIGLFVLLQILKFIALALAYGMIASIPVVAGTNPGILVGSPLNDASITSLIATPDALVVCKLHVAEFIVPGVIGNWPDAIVLTGADCQVGANPGPFEVNNCPIVPRLETVVGVNVPPPPRIMANCGN